MKKIFLSLSAIALLAAGTVSCSSSDDNNPTPVVPEPGTNQPQNTVRFNGTDTPLDFSYYELITRNYDTTSGETFEQVNVYNYPSGGYANGFYVNVGYNLTADGTDTYHYALILVPNPTITVEGGTITSFGTTVFPHQAEEITWANAAVNINGQTYESTQNNVGSGSVKVNTLVLQPNADEDLVGTSNFVSQFTLGANDFNFKFDGNTFLDYYLVNPATPASAKKSTSKNNGDLIKAEMLNNVKSLESQLKVDRKALVK